MKKVKLFMLTILLAVSGVANAQSAKQNVAAILEDFCVSYYEDAFSGKQYIEESIRVTTVEADDANGLIKVKGKHSYRGRNIPFFGRQTHSNVDFKAEIMATDSGIKIKFWKWYEPDFSNPDGFWEGPCEKTIRL